MVRESSVASTGTETEGDEDKDYQEGGDGTPHGLEVPAGGSSQHLLDVTTELLVAVHVCKHDALCEAHHQQAKYGEIAVHNSHQKHASL